MWFKFVNLILLDLHNPCRLVAVKAKGAVASAWPAPSAVQEVSLVAPRPPRFPLRVFVPPMMDSDEDQDVTTVAEQKQLRSELATALAAFDRAEDWADLIHDLQRVNRVLSKHARATSLPHKELLAKRLSQCLNASLPSGTLRVRGGGPSRGLCTRVLSPAEAACLFAAIAALVLTSPRCIRSSLSDTFPCSLCIAPSLALVF